MDSEWRHRERMRCQKDGIVESFIVREEKKTASWSNNGRTKQWIEILDHAGRNEQRGAPRCDIIEERLMSSLGNSAFCGKE